MSTRWICPRCFTSADGALAACPNCGTRRGITAVFETGEPATSSDVGAAPVAPANPVTEPEKPPAAEPSAAEPSAAEPATTFPQARPAEPTAGDGGGRWVCLRCFTSNDEASTTCAKCGLARGADPSAAGDDASGTWTAPALPTSGGGTGRGFPWRYVLYGVVGLAVVGSTLFFAARRGDDGGITGAGDLSVQDLRVGDCFDFTDEATTEGGGEVTSVRAIPCAEAHVYEVYVVAEYPAGEEASAPDELYTDWELDQCVNGFESYVGISFDDSMWYFSTLTPTTEGWNAGDRDIQCFLHNAGESPVTGSAEGTAQ
jgi:hypothetical protein